MSGTKTNKTKTAPTWSDVKTKLADFDRAGMVVLIQELYSASKENQAFLHARFGLGEDVLKPYKVIITRWLRPDLFKNQQISVIKAKKAISDYKKAIGRPDDLAELMVFYCEQAASFCTEVALLDQGYLDSLLRMFAQALKISVNLSPELRSALRNRLNQVRCASHNFYYGVGEEMDDLLAMYEVDE